MPKKQVQFYDSWVYTILEVLSEHVGTVTEWALKQHHFQMLALGVRSQSISRKKKLSWKHCKMTQFLTLYALSWFLSTKHDKFMTTQQVITFLFDPSLNITMQAWMHITVKRLNHGVVTYPGCIQASWGDRGCGRFTLVLETIILLIAQGKEGDSYPDHLTTLILSILTH